MEGYPSAAAKFSEEAKLQPQQDTSAIRARQQIQNCIHSGNIQTAIETLNELDPEVGTPLFSHLSSFSLALMIRTRVFTCTTHMAGFLACDEKHHFLYDPLLFATLNFSILYFHCMHKVPNWRLRSWIKTKPCAFLFCGSNLSS